MLRDSDTEIIGGFREALRAFLKCPELEVFAQPEWGSQNINHRILIHSFADRFVQDRKCFFSISHCPSMGVVAVAPVPVGVDIEIRSRATAQVVARVSSLDELNSAPSPSSLWSAKEAAFKALQHYSQPSVVSKISIGEWKKIDSHLETYRLLNSQDFNSPLANCGVTFHVSSYTCSFFIFYS